MRIKHPSDLPEYLTVGEAAGLLDVHPDTLKRWERAGRIAALRTPTGHRRFRRFDVERLLVPSEDVRSAS